jgi:carbon-monoxide dehydrogenase small subunit
VTTAVPISLVVNGERVEANVLPRLNLADFLREHLKLTGTHVGCEHVVCGACTVRVNGDIVRSCLLLAVQAHNATVETIEECPTVARLPICSLHSGNVMHCNAASARREC